MSGDAGMGVSNHVKTEPIFMLKGIFVGMSAG